MKETLPTRKPHRLSAYDYSAPGAYFVTICAREREALFWDRSSPVPTGADMAQASSILSSGQTLLPQNGTALPYALTKCGKDVDRAIRGIPEHYPHITVEKYVIMPNHIHMILLIGQGVHEQLISARGEAPGLPVLSTIVGQMKRWASKEAGFPLWQRSFHEHVIRNEADYREIWSYIEGNPGKWAEDRYHVPFSAGG